MFLALMDVEASVRMRIDNKFIFLLVKEVKLINVSSIELDDIVFAHTNAKLIQNIDSSIIFEKSIQRTRVTLVMRVRLGIWIARLSY